MRQSDACPFCTASPCPSFLTCRDFLGTDSAFDLRRCPSCAFVFTDPVPDEHEIAEYYASEQYAPLSPRASGWIHAVSRAIRTMRIPWKVRFVEHLSKLRGRLLDIGCGTGEFPAAANRRGWQAMGIEPDPRGREHATALGVDVRPPKDLPALPDGSFDAITLWHSLEHVHDIGSTLAHVARLLAPEGVAIIAVPNCDCLDADVYGSEWFAYDVPRHISHFTPATLHQWVARSGLQVSLLRGRVFETTYICLRTEVLRKRHPLRAVPVMLRSMWEGLRHTERCSSIVIAVRKSSQR